MTRTPPKKPGARFTPGATPAAHRRQARTPVSRRGQAKVRTWAVVVAIGVVALTAILARGSRPVQGPPSTPVVGDDLHSLVIDPADASRLFIGSHSGVSLSSDAGKSWAPIESLEGADAMGWAFTGDAIFVGGHPGIEVSNDAGVTFEPRNAGLPDTDIHALGAGGNVIYAASPGVGVIASIDGGRSWEVRTRAAGQTFMGTILVDPDDSDHLIAPDMQAGAVESTDGGRTWHALGGVQGAMWVTWNPNDTEQIIVSAMGIAVESTDGGASWHPLEIPAGASIVELSPDGPEVLYAAVHDAPEAHVFVSRDGGRTWKRP